jgi:hypothetical protein
MDTASLAQLLGMNANGGGLQSLAGLQFTQALPELLAHAKPAFSSQARSIFCVPTLQAATPALSDEFTAYEEC